MKNIETGIHKDISFKDYLEIDAINNSYLGKINHCPANVLVPDEDTKERIIGRAAHAYILEGLEAFNREFIVMPYGDGRTKAVKDLRMQLQAENIGKTALLNEDLEVIQGMAQSIIDHPTASRLLPYKSGQSEITIVWEDENTGLKCKGRPDIVPYENLNVMVDLKSTRNASDHEFRNDMIFNGYIRQAAMYLIGYSILTGKDMNLFAFIVVEKKPPYRTEVYMPDQEFIQWGLTEFDRLLGVANKCIKANHFPAYQNAGAIDMYLPSYLSARHE